MTPRCMWLDGRWWVDKADYDALAERVVEKQRDKRSHDHFFAQVGDMFASLPHRLGNAPYAATADALRKHALIETGHCDVDTVDLGSHEAAMAAAPLIAKLARDAHGYAITVVRGPLVVCSTPHSQKYKAMGKERFKKSKRDVLDWIEGLLGMRDAA